MASEGWGLNHRKAGKAAAGKKQPVLTASYTRSAHRGMISLHAWAVVAWLALAIVLGALYLLGKPVPTVLLVAPIAAAAGHGLFLAMHLLLGAKASKAGRAGTAARQSPSVQK